MTSLNAPWIVAVVVKATLLLLVVFGLSRFLRRRSAALRHLVWCAAIAGVLAVPLLSVAIPWRLPVKTRMVSDVAEWQSGRVAGGAGAAEPQSGRVAEKAGAAEGAAHESSAPPLSPARSAPASRTLDVAGLLVALWLCGGALVLLRLVLGWALVRRLVARGVPLEASEWTRPLYEAADRLGLAEVPRLVMSDRTPMPFAGGLLRPTIVLPAEATAWTGHRRRAVLAHELAHVRRADIAVNALGQIACALYWFHPLVWIAAKRLRVESERACDNLVLGLGTRPSDYADHLLQIVCGAGDARTPALALPMAERREFEGRMLAILERDASRHAPTRVHAGLLAGLAAVMVLPLAALVPTAAAPATKHGATARAPEQPRVQRPAVHQAADTPPAQNAHPRDGDAHVAIATRTDARTRTETNTRTTRQTSTEMRAAPRALAADTGDTRVASALIGTLHDPSARVRLSAVTALGNLESRQATSALADVLTHDDTAEVRQMAAWALGQIEDPSAVPALEAGLRDGTATVRETSAWALGQIEPRPAPPALLAALGDQDMTVRRTVAWALGQIGDTNTAGPLVRALDDTRDAETRATIIWALGEMDMAGPARDAMIKLLKDPDPEVRAAAAHALGGGSMGPRPEPRPRP